jgi:hypothetical protein
MKSRTAPRKRLGIAGLVVVVALASLVVSSTSATGANAPNKSKFTVVPNSTIKQTTTFTGSKSAVSDLVKTDPSLLNQSSSAPVAVFVKYDVDSTASYAGGVKGYAATSPRATGKSFKDNAQAVNAYRGYATGKIQQITSSALSSVSGFQWKQNFTDVYGGVTATVPANQVASLLSVPGVVAVQKDKLEQPDAYDEENFIGATNAWNSLGGGPNAGKGVVVGVLDTGIWPENPFFAVTTQGAPAQPHACQFGDGTNPNLGAAFTCNDKLIGAYSFMDTYMHVVGAGATEFCDQASFKCSPRDSEGHGTHTSSTAAGDQVASAPLFGVERGPISGVAPGAQVIMFRVCGELGCFGSDSVAAVNQAIADGVNVLNFSIGGGASPYTDPVEIAFLDAFNAGISVNASAGNSGPGGATVEHNGPWVTTVGAVTSDRQFLSTLNLKASDNSTFTKAGVTITAGISTPTPVVLAAGAPYSDKLCGKPAPAGTFTGKIVVCERGGVDAAGNAIGRIQKGWDVLQGGAAGMILYNPVTEDTETDNHFLPVIHVDGPATDLLNYISSHTGVTATWATGQPTHVQGDVMAAFSSRGPAPDFIKPDIVAPGVQVLAGNTPQPVPPPAGVADGAPGTLFQAIAGTSMASPHAAGSSALIKAAHPDWDPAEIKSALMTSSVQDVVQADGTSATTPFDTGAGSIRVDKALNPTLVFDETTADYVSSATDPASRVNLNIPSIDATTMPGTVTTTRTATNVTGHEVDMDVATSAPDGATITVNYGQRGVHFSSRRPTTFKITISAPSLADGQYFGRITLTPRGGGNPVTIPVAFNRTQGDVKLVNSCAPTTFKAISEHTHCTVAAQNFNAGPANVKLEVNGFQHGQPPLIFSHINAPAHTFKTPLGFLWRGQLSPAIPPQVTSVAPSGGTGPAGGYLPLSLFGIAPVSGIGDETITNFSVPDFKYGGEDYNSLAIDSNGYVVVGGGDGTDNSCCNMPDLPDPGKPNNTLAPFWTDLNPADAAAPAGSGIRIGSLTDGVTSWTVVDFNNVPLFGGAKLETFEIWIQQGTTEGIWYDFGPVSDPGNLTGVVIGAENRDGTSGVTTYSDPEGGPVGGTIGTVPANNDEYAVILSGPTAGGSVSIDYDATALKAGTYTETANLTSDVTPGVTQVTTQLTATSPPKHHGHGHGHGH